jgi:pimeloyl-ACP methyl ester carboxylesterase
MDKIIFFSLVLVFSILLSSCTGPAAPSATDTLVAAIAVTPVPSATTQTLPMDTPSSSPTLIPSLTYTSVPTNKPSPTGTPDVPSEEVNFITEDNVNLGATHFGSDGDLAVLLLHMGKAKASNNTQKDWHSFARFLAGHDFPALTLDFRGRGKSGGEVENDLLPLDVLAALRFLQDRGYERIVCVGAGMGGLTCMRLALDGVDFEGLVILSMSLEAGPTNKVAESEIPQIDIPKLYLYGENDGYGFSDAMEAIYAASAQPKEMIVCPDTAAHGTELLHVDCGDEVRQKILAFLRDFR